MTSRAEYCVIACAEAWRGDGEILASPFGWIPTIGARLARLTFEPDLVLSDGEATAIGDTPGLGVQSQRAESWLPFRYIFDLLSAGRRHVMMGAVQIDRHGNQNISCVGDHAQPKTQLIGCRGGPGNAINHATSYFVPQQSARGFVEQVDFVSAPGPARGGQTRFVITDLGVYDFADDTMRLRSIHPGVSIEDVRAATGFDLEVASDVPQTREPTADELHLIRDVLDPGNLRDTEVS